MTIDGLLDKLWEIRFTSGMNVRYYQAEIDGMREQLWLLVPAAFLLFVVSVSLLLAWAATEKRRYGIFAGASAFVFVLVFGTMVNRESWRGEYQRRCAGWHQLLADSNGAYLRAYWSGEATDKCGELAFQECQELLRTKDELNAREYEEADHELLDRCYGDECQLHTGKRKPDEDETND